MGVFNKFKDLMGFEEYEDEEELEEEEEYEKNNSYYDRKPVEPRTQTTTSPRDTDSGNVVPMQNRTVKAITTAFKLVVIEPKGFEECPKLVDSLKEQKADHHQSGTAGTAIREEDLRLPGWCYLCTEWQCTESRK